MNPLTNVKNITKLNETELATGSIHKKSWHDMYKGSAWIFIGGLEYGLTEGDVLAVFSQYGEIENINLVRDKKTGKSKGYCFLCYSNQKSTVLAVDNFNGIKLCNRTIRVDHVADYKPPKENERDDEITKVLKSEGCAPQVVQKLSKQTPEVKNDTTSESKSKKKKSKKEKKEKKKKKRKHKSDSEDSDDETRADQEVKVKKEKQDSGYDKYDISSHHNRYTNERLPERKSGYSNGECSYSNERDRLKSNKKHFKTEKSDDLSRYKTKIKSEPESDGEHSRTGKDRLKVKSGAESRNKNDNDDHHSSSKKHKRKRASSSSDDDDQSKKHKRKKAPSSDDDDQIKKHKRKRAPSSDDDDNYDDRTSNFRKKDKHDRSGSKKHLKHKKKSKNVEDSSCSSDDASSTESSSEDEKRDNSYSRKEKHKTLYVNRSNREDNRDKSYHRTEESYSSSKSKYHNTSEKYVEHKSKTKYKDDERMEDKDDSHYKDAHNHKRKSNR